MDNNPDGPAVSKRIKISKTQQEMLLIATLMVMDTMTHTMKDSTT